MQHHGQGELSIAEVIYQKILKTGPDQPVALHLLGAVAPIREELEGFFPKRQWTEFTVHDKKIEIRRGHRKPGSGVQPRVRTFQGR